MIGVFIQLWMMVFNAFLNAKEQQAIFAQLIITVDIVVQQLSLAQELKANIAVKMYTLLHLQLQDGLVLNQINANNKIQI